MTGIFKYAANPTMVLGVSDQQTNARAELLPASARLSRILWSIDEDAGTIALVRSKNTLVLGITGGQIRSGSPIVLQEKTAGAPSQSWDFVSKTNFILSCVNKSLVIDGTNRGISSGTPLQLCEFNGSPAQQWIFTPMDTYAVTEVTADMLSA